MKTYTLKVLVENILTLEDILHITENIWAPVKGN